MMILEIEGEARVAVWDDEEGRLVEYGWIELDKGLEGWTIWHPEWPSGDQ